MFRRKKWMRRGERERELGDDLHHHQPHQPNVVDEDRSFGGFLPDADLRFRNGSTVSLPAHLHPRSDTSQSNYSSRTVPTAVDPSLLPRHYNAPATLRLPAVGNNFPSSPASAFEATESRPWAFLTSFNAGSRKVSADANMPPRRPSDKTTASPTALPQKALAFLGLEERARYNTQNLRAPHSPTSVPRFHDPFDGELADIENDDEEEDEVEDDEKVAEDEAGRLKKQKADRKKSTMTLTMQKQLQAAFPPRKDSLQQVSLQKQRQDSLDPTPERLYFRPESLCSSFSTSSDASKATTMTTITTTSPSVVSLVDGKADTEHSESTIRESTIEKLQPEIVKIRQRERPQSLSELSEMPDHGSGMVNILNLDDSDDEAANVLREKESEAKSNSGKRKPGELPLEIAMQICSYFTTTRHTDDRRDREGGCPNCDLHVLWSLALVSKGWSKAANQALYQTIALDFGYYTGLRDGGNGVLIPPRYKKYTECTNESGAPLHMNDDVEERLDMLYRTLWANAEIGERIRGIKLPRRLFSLSKYPLASVIKSCPKLQFIDHAVASGNVDELVPLMKGMKDLRTWTWRREALAKQEQAKAKKETSYVDVWKKTYKAPMPEAILQVFPEWTQLEHLELANLSASDLPAGLDFSVLTGLKSVKFSLLPTTIDGVAAKLFDSLPPVEKLTIDRLASFPYKALLDYLRRSCSVKNDRTLKTLEILEVDVKVEQLYELLAYCPNLVNLQVSNRRLKSPHPSSPVSLNRPRTPNPKTLRRLPELRFVNIDIKDQAECVKLLLALTNREKACAPKLDKIRLGFKSGGGRPDPVLLSARSGELANGRESRTMLDEGTKLMVKLQMECMFSGVQLAE